MVDVHLNPSKVNYINNPSFEINTTGWAISSYSLSRFDTTDDGDPLVVTHPGPAEIVGNRYLLEYGGGTSEYDGVFITPTITSPEVLAGNFFSWSIYAQGDGVGGQIGMVLEAAVKASFISATRVGSTVTVKFNSAHPFKPFDLIQVTSDDFDLLGQTGYLTEDSFIGLDTVVFESDPDLEGMPMGPDVPNTVSTIKQVANNVVLLEEDTEWRRLSTTLYVPDYWSGYPAYLLPKITVLGTQAVYFEGAQLEEGQRASDYFDGSLTSQGCGWEGTPHASASGKYINRRRRLLRLENEIESYLPINTVYRISDYLLTQDPHLSV
jgi:hypothetical protein